MRPATDEAAGDRATDRRRRTTVTIGHGDCLGCSAYVATCPSDALKMDADGDQ